MNREEAIKIVKSHYPANKQMLNEALETLIPELKESEDELTWLKNYISEEAYYLSMDIRDNEDSIKLQKLQKSLAWLEKQGKNNTGISETTKQKLEDNLNKALEKETPESWNEFLDEQGKQKELKLVEILKHYPRETELYSPLYGKLWLAEVDEENEIITCYKYPLDEGCTRAILEQENTISFYSDGTTGLPDCTISKDCMLFLYNKNQSEPKPVEWSEEDEKIMSTIMEEGDLKPSERNWLKSLKGRVQPQSKQEWSEEDTDYVMYI